MKTCLMSGLLIGLVLVACKTKQKHCNYQFSVNYNMNGLTIVIHEADNVKYESPSLYNDFRSIILDSIYNKYTQSKVYITCNSLDSYCVLGMYYKDNVDCAIKYIELGELTEMTLFLENIDINNIDLKNEKMFFLSKKSDRYVSIFTNVIVDDEDHIKMVSGASAELLLDLKTMSVTKVKSREIKSH